MAHRNPMNERYLGDGPQGKTRKSAAKLKPKSEAASSVHIEKKPTTKQERKMAAKKRAAQEKAKEAERKRKAEERERKAREALGEVVEESKAQTMGDKVKGVFFGPKKQDSSSASGTKSGATTAAAGTAGAAGTKGKSTGGTSAKTSSTATPKPGPFGSKPNTPEYKRLKLIYRGLLAFGIVMVVASFLLNYIAEDVMAMFGDFGMYAPIVIAYPALIAAIILDMTKLKKMERAHVTQPADRKSPKEQKHSQQKAEAAYLLEEAKRAEKAQKRANSKIPFLKPKTKAQDSSGAKASEDASTINAVEAIEEVIEVSVDSQNEVVSDAGTAVETKAVASADNAVEPTAVASADNAEEPTAVASADNAAETKAVVNVDKKLKTATKVTEKTAAVADTPKISKTVSGTAEKAETSVRTERKAVSRRKK